MCITELFPSLMEDIARHCSLGDHVVLLEDSRLQKQQTSSTDLHDPKAVYEEVTEPTQNSRADVDAGDTKRQSQRDALNDLARSTGDLALYSTCTSLRAGFTLFN